MTARLTPAVDAAMREAATRAILPRYQSLAAHEIDAKAADDVVTVADKEAEAILGLALSAALPEAAFVGEEAVHADPALADRLADSLCWIVDPLDGTNNFARGHGPFGVMVALADRGEILAGWMFDPLSGRLCEAHLGGGAWINGTRIAARATGQSPPIAAISLVFMDESRRTAIRQHIAPHYTLVDIPRCAAEQYPRIATGVNDCTVFGRALAWDHAPGALFVNEAGGKVARPDGRPYRAHEWREPDLIGAATPALWDELAGRISAL